MRRLSSKEIISKISDVQSITLPNNWFDYLNIHSDKSVFFLLYEWMIKEGDVSEKNFQNLHNITYIGNSVYKKLLAAEKRRLKNKLKKLGEDLEKAVAWSDINSGLKTYIGGLEIGGDSILVIPKTSQEALNELSFNVFKEEIKKAINKAKGKAAGTTFYQWLVSQLERPDNVGDLARDAKADRNCHREFNNYQDSYIYLNKCHSCSGAIDALKYAWLEYISQYPERITPLSWCDECGKKFNPEQTKLLYNKDGDDIYVLCDKCEKKYISFCNLTGIDLFNINREKIIFLRKKIILAHLTLTKY